MSHSTRQHLPLLITASRLFVSSAIWRFTGSERFGNVLIEGLDSPDENLRMISGTLLSRAGSRIIPMLRGAIKRQQNLPMILTIIGDVGGLEQASLLEQYMADERPDVARAARDALRVLRTRNE
jgi:hypothetical protein